MGGFTLKLTIKEKLFSNTLDIETKFQTYQFPLHILSRINLSLRLQNLFLEFKFKRNTYSEIGLSERETIYLQQKTNCTVDDQSFYDCLTPKLLNKGFASCKNKCLPMTIHEKFGKPKYPYCELGTEEFICANDYAFNYLLNASSSGECLRPCKINEYFGKVTYYDDKWGRDTAFSYYYKPPEAKNIEAEYLIYDNIGVLSAVGGLLGLFLGFSLRGK